MGSWNETCFLSNLAIEGGDPVVGFLVAIHHYTDQNPYLGSHYATDTGSPFGLPFYGKYNSYGTIEDFDVNSIAAKYNKHILGAEDFSEVLSRIERAACSPKDGTVDVNLDRYSELTFETEDKYTRKENPVPVTLVMAHRDIVDALLEEYNIGALESYEPTKESFLYGLSQLRNRKVNLSTNYMNTTDLNLNVNITEKRDYDNMIGFVLNHDQSVDEEFAELLLIDYRMKTIMMKLRKLWMGTTGKGSQSSFRRTHLLLAEATKKHIIDSFESPEDTYEVLLTGRDY